MANQRVRKTGPRTDKRTGVNLPPAGPESGDESVLRKLAQELQIHQVELEMQNQALREAQRELELSLSLYPATGFYDHKRVETLGDIESCPGIAQIFQNQSILRVQCKQVCPNFHVSWVRSRLCFTLGGSCGGCLGDHIGDNG